MFSFQNYRLLVDTPSKLEQLKSGAIGAGFDAVNITFAAHPEILLQPQYFANTSFTSLTFSTQYQVDVITIYPGEFGRVDAFFNDTGVRLDGIPATYQSYYINYKHSGQIPDQSIDTIFTWTNAVELFVSHRGTANVALKLQNRAAELAAMEKLQRLALCVHGYDDAIAIKINEFTENVPSLKLIQFHTINMSDREIGRFAQLSNDPKHFTWVITGYEVLFMQFEESDDD